MVQAVDSGGAGRPVKNQQKIRNEAIKTATNDLNDKKIGIMEFLARVTCKTEKCVMDMAHFEVPREYHSDDSSDDDEVENVVDNNGHSTLNLNITDDYSSNCSICSDGKSSDI